MQARNFILTIKADTTTPEEIISLPYDYIIGQKEKGEENGFEHYQVYIHHKNGIHFETLKKKFPTAHIERRLGNHQQAHDYCSKSDTRIGETFEKGTFIPEEPGKRNELEEIKKFIQDGATYDDILEEFSSSCARYGQFVKEYINRIQREKFSNSVRNLEVVYIYGNPGVGKSKYVYSQVGSYKDVFRITEYNSSGKWDSYNGQDVLLLDEFRTSLTMQYLLELLDIYPMELQARYVNKIACFTKVYILSNIDLYSQYPNIQVEEPETFKALLRRISRYYQMTDDGGLVELDKNRKPFQNEYLEQKARALFGNLVHVES